MNRTEIEAELEKQRETWHELRMVEIRPDFRTFSASTKRHHEQAKARIEARGRELRQLLSEMEGSRTP